MASIRTVFEALLELPPGEKIRIPLASKQEHETVRSRLSHFWAERKEIITAVTDDDPMLSLGLCGDFYGGDSSSGTSPYGEYYLGPPRKRIAKQYSFQIVKRDE